MSTPSDSPLMAATNDFAFRLFDQLAQHDAGANRFCSPVSIAIALAMATNGARGQTQKAMAKTLGIDKLDLQGVNQGYAALLGGLTSLDPKVETNVANSLWVSADAEVKPEFVETGQTAYQAEIRTIKFDGKAAEVINEWVEQKTNRRIKRLLSANDLPPTTLMALLNAIYFKGAWTRAFEAKLTRDGDFTNADGSKQKAKLMRQSGKFGYFSDEQMQIVRLPYGAKRTSMVIVLPQPEVKIDEFARGLTAERWSQWTRPLMSREGNVVLPRFKVEYEIMLNDVLSAMGMEIAFSDQADFSGMFVKDNATISAVKHKAFVEVNEEGTEAAAATAVVMAKTLSLGPGPFRFVADRPFFYAIQDGETGAILFMGILASV